jgi:hypothetical protein
MMLAKRILGAVFAVLMACGVTVGVASAAQATNTIPPSSQFAEIFPPFFNTNQSKCLDVPTGSGANGLIIEVFHCHGYDSRGEPQRWIFLNRGLSNGNEIRWEIMNVASSKCLNLATTNSAGVQSVIQEPCLGSGGSIWFVRNTTVGSNFGLVNALTAKCMATDNSSGSDKTKVEVAPCNYNNQNDPNFIRQVWSIG